MKSVLRRIANRLNRESGSPNETKNVELENLESRLLFSAAPVEGPADEVENPEAGGEAPAADVQVEAQSTQASAAAPTETESASELPASGQSGVSTGQGVTLVDVSPEASTLNQETLEAVAEEAADRWRATGLTAAQETALDEVSYEIGNIGIGSLARFEDNVITVDDDAAASGSWFIDSTLGLDEEFGADGSALAGTAAAGRHDLLAILIHEQGHLLGLDDTPGSGDAMDSFFRRGTRAMLEPDAAAGAVPGSLDGAHYAITDNNSAVAKDAANNMLGFTVNSGTDRLLIVFVAEGAPGALPSITDVSYNGSSLTFLGEAGLPAYDGLEAWYTTLGTGVTDIVSTITVTSPVHPADGFDMVIAAVAYDGVDQGTPIDGFQSFIGGAATTTLTTMVTSEANGDRVVGAGWGFTDPLAVGPDQTVIHNAQTNPTQGVFMSSSEPGTATPVTHSYTGTNGAYPLSLAFNVNTAVAVVASGQIKVESISPAPEVQLSDGDSTPTRIDLGDKEGTHFGSVDTATGSVTRTFRITNSGGADLNLTGPNPVTLTGADASHFSVVQPASLTLGTNVGTDDTTTFTVTYNPTADGHHDGVTLHIASDDPDAAEADFDFALEGIGTTDAISLVTQLGSVGSVGGDEEDTISSFTVAAGNNRLLVVYAFEEDSNTITDVSFDGTSLTLLGGVSGGTGLPADQRLEVWYAPMGSGAAESGDVVMTAHGGADAKGSAVAAVVYQNVDQSSPVDGFDSTFGTVNFSELVIASEAGDLVAGAHFNDSVGNVGVNDPTIPTIGAGTGQATVHDLDVLGNGVAYLHTTTEDGGVAIDTLFDWTNNQDSATLGFNINAAPPAPDIDWDDNTASVPAGATVTVEDAGTPANNDAGAANTIAFQDRVVNHNDTASSTLNIDLQAVGTADSFSLAAGGANSSSVTFSPGSGGPISAPTAATITGLGFDASIDDTAGTKSATVTSTDGNTAAADDIDDVLNLSTNVFDPANASFSDSADQNTRTIDFGSQTANSGNYTDTWAITNLEGVNNFTLDLDFLSIADDGDPGPFDANSLAAALFGDQQEDVTSGNYTAAFDTTGLAAGTYTENFTLTFATDDASEGNDVLGVGGLATQTLTLTLTAVITAAGPPATEETGVSISGTNLVITDVLGGNTADDLTISTTATTVTIVDNNGNGIDLGAVTGTGDGTSTVTIDLTEFTGGIVWNALDGNDTLRVDFDPGDFTRTITFNGGDQPIGDQLFLEGSGTFAEVTYDFLNENDGSITITGNSLISYTGLEPITQVIVGDAVTFNYSSASETIDIRRVGADTVIDSTAGESVTILSHGLGLTINAGDGDDTINVDGLSALFDAALTIDGQVGSDIINYRADGVSLDTGRSATFDAERIDFVFGDLTTSTGDIIVRGTGGSGSSYIGVRLLGSDLTTTGSGNIDIDGEGGDIGSNNQGIQLAASSSLTTTGGGTINVDGTGGGTGSAGHGVAIFSGSSLSATGGGTLMIDGASSTTGTSSNHGVFFANGTSATVDNGDLTIQGTGAGSLGINNGINGINAEIASTGSGNIIGTGTSIGVGSNNQGIILSNTTVGLAPLTPTGTGSISLNGFGSTSGLSNNEGVRLANTDLETGGNGVIDIDGTGGGTGSGTNNTGVAFLTGSTAAAAGSGALTIDGSGGNGSLFNRGVYATGGISLTTVDGTLTIDGTGDGSASFNRGVEIVGSTVSAAAGTGAVTLNGTGSASSSGLFNTGVYLASSTVSASHATTGDITITGVGGSGSSYNEGVRIQSSSVTTSGTTDIIGIASLGTTGVANSGVYIYFNSTVNGDSSSAITGTGGGGTAFNHGIVMNIGITSNVPLANIVGVAGSGTSEDETGNFF